MTSFSVAPAEFAVNPLRSPALGKEKTIHTAEVLSALTYALDITDGQRPGHTLRTTIIAMRMGAAVELNADQIAALYYACLLKDAGCSSNAARMAALFGSDDHPVKRNMRLVDWNDILQLTLRTAKNCGVGLSPVARLRHLLLIARTPNATQELIEARCYRGAEIAHGLGFSLETAETIEFVDEQWCGKGHPAGKSGVEIPILSRILLLSQTFEAFWTELGLDAAVAMARARRGTWFDPRLVDVIVAWRHEDEWWRSISDRNHLDSAVIALEPGSERLVASPEKLDAIAQAFASVIDAKTPFTWRHSTNVAAYAAAIARSLGANETVTRDVMRAGLLHDIGKLGISNRILDKPASLTDTERVTMKQHPLWTMEILKRVPAFHSIAHNASMHHERLDGRGYPWGLRGDELEFTPRLLAIADSYEAITADRPYREHSTADDAVKILGRYRGTAFDAQMVDAAATLALDGTFASLANRNSPFLVRLR